MRFDDSLARRRIETEIDATFLVEAAAGTGKTTCLVGRLITVLGAGTDIGSVVAVTFTDKAAGELRLRLRAGLERAKAGAAGSARRGFADALANLEQARVSTIHRFASDLLRERPIEAGVDPDFSPCSPSEQRALLAEAFGRWLERVEARPSPALTRYFARPGASAWALRAAAQRLIEHRHLPAPWLRRPVDLAAESAALCARVRLFAGRASQPRSKTDRLFAALAPVFELERRLARHDLDPFAREAALIGLAQHRWDFGHGYGSYGAGVERSELVGELDALKVALAGFAAAASADLAVELRDDLLLVADLYRELKSRRGALDFDDLLIGARDLMLSSPELLALTRARLTRFFVDEFQDTDSAQAALLLTLAGKGDDVADPFALELCPGRLFLVGDPKQSIYRFRQADPGTYLLARARVLASGGEVLNLSTSFRSVPGIVAYVNAAFAPIMTGDALAEQAAYVPLSAHAPAGPQPAVVALPVPRPYGRQRVPKPTKTAVRASHPGSVADFIAWLVRTSGRLVRDAQGELVPIRPEHIAVLFKQFESYGELRPEVFSRGLSRHGIPHVVLGGRALGDREESHALVTALGAIEFPDDAVLVYGALRGPLFGFTDETLFLWSQRYGGLRPLAPPITALPSSLGHVGDALAHLGRLHFARNRRPAAETLTDLLAVTRASVAFALSPSAEQAFLQIGALEQIAIAHERSGGLSFRSFVEALGETGIDRGAEAEDLDEDAGGVRLMTVHRAKGLEFPVVILADPSIPAAREPDKIVDGKHGLAALSLAGCAPWELCDGLATERLRAAAEGARVAYVAATRARDLLVVPIVGDDPSFPIDGWLAPLAAALEPLEPRAPLRTDGCLGNDTVLARPDEVDRPVRSLAPGVHAMAWGEAFVSDPAAAESKHVDGGRFAPLDLISKDVSPELCARDAEGLAAFNASRAHTIASASLAPFGIETVTSRAQREKGLGVARACVARAPDRPRGKRFGTLVHTIMATTSLDAEPERVLALAKALARLLGAPAEEAQAAAVAVTAALHHPILTRARAAASSGKLHREVPVTLLAGDREVVDGVIDLAIEEGDVMFVFDYKTDDPSVISAEHLAAYEAQVTLYARAIREATGLAAEPGLFFI